MKKNSGQTALENAVLIIIVVAGLLAMFKFLQNGAQGRIRQAADTFGAGEQYESGATKCYDETSRQVSGVKVSGVRSILLT